MENDTVWPIRLLGSRLRVGRVAIRTSPSAGFSESFLDCSGWPTLELLR